MLRDKLPRFRLTLMLLAVAAALVPAAALAATGTVTGTKGTTGALPSSRRYP